MNYLEISKLINKLITNPSCDKEIGYNSAIIEILKDLNKEKLNRFDYALRLTFDKLNLDEKLFNLISSRQSEIRCYLESEPIEKLNIIKIIKDITALGLKEAKDLTDCLIDYYNHNRQD